MTTDNTQAGLTYQAQTLAAGVANGWDIDVFWCAGGDETARFNAGQQVATALVAWLNAGGKPASMGLDGGFRRIRTVMVTPYYISVFVCSTAQAV